MSTLAGSRADTGFDRRGLADLGSGHFVIDACVGAVPAVIPVFVTLYALSDLQASLILAASLVVSSATQPLFGLLADRSTMPAFVWGGVALAAIGFALSGVAGSYAGVMALIVVSGVGVAAFHPEAARVSNQIAGHQKATGLAWFMVGGNAGFAAGPLLVAAFIPLLAERATLVFLLLGAAVSAWLWWERQRLAVPVPIREPSGRVRGEGGRSHVPGLTLLLVVTSLRTWTQFGLLALGPLFLVGQRGFSDAAAGFSVFYFAFAGAAGTIVGAAIAERVGGRRMLVWTMPLATPLVAGFLLADGALGLAFLSAAGFVLMASFSVTVVMGQDYLPHRLALAAGLMIGFGAIGSAAPGLALFGALADAAGRETALWVIAALPVLGGLLAIGLPSPRRAEEAPA
ncbi:MAG: MFS transporter [Miltoncostaeaceae bacterium]